MGLELIKGILGKDCHVAKAVRERIKLIEEQPETVKTLLLLEVLLCASCFKAYDVPSPTMDLARPYFEAVRAGILIH